MTRESGRVLTVLLNYRTAEMTARSLKAAREAMRHVPGEIIVVDNDSQDGSFEFLQNEIAKYLAEDGYPQISAIQTGHNGGFGYGNNAGFHAGLSRGEFEFLYALNSDAFPAEDAISKLREFMMNKGDVAIAGSELFGEDDQRHVAQFRFPSIFSEFEGAFSFGPVTRLLKRYQVPLFGLPEDHPTQVDWIAGASFMMRREAAEDVGLFDESYFLYFEETDLCLRTARAGWKTYYVPESRVKHIGSVSTGMRDWERAPKFWLDSRLYYFTKNHGAIYALAATLARLLGGALSHLRALVQPKKRRSQPKWYLWDIAKHHLRHLFKPTHSPKIPNAQQAAE